MHVFKRIFGEIILIYLLNSPVEEISWELYQKTCSFKDLPYTDAELYDFIDEIKNFETTKFFRQLCNMDLFQRPNEFTHTEVNLKSLEQELIQGIYERS